MYQIDRLKHFIVYDKGYKKFDRQKSMRYFPFLFSTSDLLALHHSRSDNDKGGRQLSTELFRYYFLLCFAYEYMFFKSMD